MTIYDELKARGLIAQVTDEEEKILALRALCQKLTPQAMDGDKFQNAVSRSLSATGVWRVDMEEISGKEKAPKKT